MESTNAVPTPPPGTRPRSVGMPRKVAMSSRPNSQHLSRGKNTLNRRSSPALPRLTPPVSPSTPHAVLEVLPADMELSLGGAGARESEWVRMGPDTDVVSPDGYVVRVRGESEGEDTEDGESEVECDPPTTHRPMVSTHMPGLRSSAILAMTPDLGLSHPPLAYGSGAQPPLSPTWGLQRSPSHLSYDALVQRQRERDRQREEGEGGRESGTSGSDSGGGMVGSKPWPSLEELTLAASVSERQFQMVVGKVAGIERTLERDRERGRERERERERLRRMERGRRLCQDMEAQARRKARAGTRRPQLGVVGPPAPPAPRRRERAPPSDAQMHRRYRRRMQADARGRIRRQKGYAKEDERLRRQEEKEDARIAASHARADHWWKQDKRRRLCLGLGCVCVLLSALYVGYRSVSAWSVSSGDPLFDPPSLLVLYVCLSLSLEALSCCGAIRLAVCVHLTRWSTLLSTLFSVVRVLPWDRAWGASQTLSNMAEATGLTGLITALCLFYPGSGSSLAVSVCVLPLLQLGAASAFSCLERRPLLVSLIATFTLGMGTCACAGAGGGGASVSRRMPQGIGVRRRVSPSLTSSRTSITLAHPSRLPTLRGTLSPSDLGPGSAPHTAAGAGGDGLVAGPAIDRHGSLLDSIYRLGPGYALDPSVETHHVIRMLPVPGHGWGGGSVSKALLAAVTEVFVGLEGTAVFRGSVTRPRLRWGIRRFGAYATPLFGHCVVDVHFTPRPLHTRGGCEPVEGDDSDVERLLTARDVRVQVERVTVAIKRIDRSPTRRDLPPLISHAWVLSPSLPGSARRRVDTFIAPSIGGGYSRTEARVERQRARAERHAMLAEDRSAREVAIGAACTAREEDIAAAHTRHLARSMLSILSHSPKTKKR
ncbi:hypothetical protein KIPB_006412 [Kipferlia bialata]|uniref:Uncharacterized protein n=1 Tax=Kipferlia bialata TaxID=797122 RepID=A0A9K3CVM4_9EUKA|nr:hypothetical protein KIPB_002027 [Kipferlia bialata]GIQ82429.1 hypothetical protein KIPB_003566 [Kipferlia bialata]GIQ84841.1 hypothetical protein KIPB_006412 [Kipferlia bialata]|eukprot:g2027.t1